MIKRILNYTVYLFAFLWILLIISIVWNQWEESKIPSIERIKITCNKFKEQEYAGIVKKTLGYYIYIENQKHTYHYYDYCGDLFSRIEIGDSIVKLKNTFDLHVYKHANSDSVVFFKCSFDCNTVKIK